MKKQLTVALLSTLAASAFAAEKSAQDEDSHVKLTGYLRGTVQFMNEAQNDAFSKLVKVPSANGLVKNQRFDSRTEFNFKGRESLGNGNAAVWQVGTRLSTGGTGYDDYGGERTGVLGNRDTFVGLEGRWGRFVLGHNHTIFNDGKYDTSKVAGLDNLPSFFGDSPATNVGMFRLDSGNLFTGPDGGKFKIKFQRASKGDKTATTPNTDTNRANISYDADMWGFSANYSQAKVKSTLTPTGIIPTLTSDSKIKFLHFTANVNFKDMGKIGIEAQENRVTPQSGATTGTNQFKTRTMGVYAQASFGPVDVLAQYGISKARDYVDAGGVARNGKTRAIVAGAHYNFSKRTLSFLEYMNLKLDANSALLSTGQTSQKRSSIAFGLQHAF